MEYAGYGTLNAPLVVESLQEMKAEAKMTRRTVWTLIVGAVTFCIVTFGMCVLAMEQTKEVVVVDAVLMDKATNSPVATRHHEELIDNPLSATAASGVEWITMYNSDGSMNRYSVVGFSKITCSPKTDAQCLKSGKKYVFHTPQGDFAGHPAVSDAGEAYLTFSPLATKEGGRSLLAAEDYDSDYADATIHLDLDLSINVKESKDGDIELDVEKAVSDLDVEDYDDYASNAPASKRKLATSFATGSPHKTQY